MNKTSKSIFLLGVTALFLTACGSNSKPNASDAPASSRGVTLSMACFEETSTTSTSAMALVANCYVHSVDGNSNPVTGLKFNVSLVNNLKFSSQETGNIFTTTPTTFTDDVEIFSNPKLNIAPTDNLIILPTATTTDPAYLGNWEIGGVTNELTLTNRAINLESAEDLSYVIGNETRYGLGTSASAHIVYPEDTTGNNDAGTTSTTETNTDGFFFFDIVYDPALRGETIFVGAHTSGNRMGTAIAVALKSLEEETNPGDSNSTDSNSTDDGSNDSGSSTPCGGSTSGSSTCSGK